MTLNSKTVAQRVRDIVLDDLHTDDAEKVRNDQPLFYVAAAEKHDAAIARGCVGLDSLDRVEIVMYLEEEFRIDITDDDAAGFETIEGIIIHVERALADQD